MSPFTRRTALCSLALVGVGALGGAVAPSPALPPTLRQDKVIPWLPLRPTAAAPPRLAPPCRAVHLQATLQFQGALGALVGHARLRNVGERPCSLRGRPAMGFDGGAATETRWRIVAALADPRDTSLIYDRGSSLRALAPGRAAALPLLWRNWCPPGTTVTTTGSPPARLIITLPQRGDLEVRVDRAPRCDEPERASILAVKPFAAIGRPAAPRSLLPLNAAIVGTAQVKPGLAALRARRGDVLRYRVVVTNVSRRPFRFTSCPVYEQHLAPRGARERYGLNCRPVGLLRPGGRVTFAMHLRVPRATPPGLRALLWVLGPTTYVPRTASARLVVTG